MPSPDRSWALDHQGRSDQRDGHCPAPLQPLPVRQPRASGVCVCAAAAFIAERNGERPRRHDGRCRRRCCSLGTKKQVGSAAAR
jgi:hypothetical protein